MNPTSLIHSLQSTLAHASDRSLLADVLAGRGEVAFEEIVRRHGPMVFRVCSRVLGRQHDAEDAFQATFVVLFRRADHVAKPDSLGSWLHGVAVRVSREILTMRRRRQQTEVATPNPARSEPNDAAEQAELAAWLDAELANLPPHYRVPLVLCELQGRSRREAARELGVPEGTLSSRLAKAKKLLGERLALKGAPAVALGSLFATEAGAVVPPALAVRTVQILVGVSAGTVPAAIDRVATGVLKAMIVINLKKLAGAVVALLLGAGGLTMALAGSAPSERRTDTPAERLKVPTVAKVSKAPVPAAKEPEWKTEFRKVYGLKDGELIRRVAPPYPECRAEYFKDRMREVYKRSKLEPPAEVLNRDYTDYFTKFGWKDGWPVDGLGMQNTPVKPDVGVRLVQLMHMATGFGHTRTEGDAGLLERKVTGDFVVRADADPAKVAAALEKILRKDCDLAVSLAVAEVERDVYTLSGKYEAKPLADRKKNLIEIYGFELADRKTGGGGSGSLQKMADHIEGFCESRFAIGEIEGAPKQVEWHFNARSSFTAMQRAQDTDPGSVMANIEAQTGLTAKLEKRKIKVLVVEKAE